MSAAPVPSPAIRGRSPLRIALWIACSFIAVWAVLALYWRSIQHVPSSTELLLNGIGVPLLLVIGIAGIRKGLFAPSQGAASPLGPVEAAPSGSGSENTSQPTAKIALLDASMRLPAGMNVDEVLAVAREGKVVGLHPSLLLRNGAKAFANAAASIWHDDFEGALTALDVDPRLNDEQRRAIVLAAETIDELLERHATTPVIPTAETMRALAPRFKLHLLLPERWRADAVICAAWLDRHLARGHWLPAVEPATTAFAAQAVGALALLDALTVELAAQPSSVRHILLACDSSLSQATVDALDDAGLLFAHNRPDGLVLGEGACALLLAPPAAAGATQVHRLASAARTTHAELAPSSGEQQSATLVQLLESACGHASTAGLTLMDCALVSDADQRVSRRSEMANTAQQAWPDTDSRLRCCHLGLAKGSRNAALALGTVVAAAAHCNQTLQPTFAASLGDPLERGVVLVIPGNSVADV
jgi:hypothetical protein